MRARGQSGLWVKRREREALVLDPPFRWNHKFRANSFFEFRPPKHERKKAKSNLRGCWANGARMSAPVWAAWVDDFLDWPPAVQQEALAAVLREHAAVLTGFFFFFFFFVVAWYLGPAGTIELARCKNTPRRDRQDARIYPHHHPPPLDLLSATAQRRRR